MMTAAFSQSPAVPGPVPRAQLPHHPEVHGHIAGQASSAHFVEEEAGPQEGEVPCPVPRQFRPQPWLTDWHWQGEWGSVSVHAGPAPAGWGLRASPAGLAPGPPVLHASPAPPANGPLQGGARDPGRHPVNVRGLNPHHGLLWLPQGGRESTGQGVQRPGFLSPNCHSLIGFVTLAKSLLCSELPFPCRMELIRPPHR